MAMQLISFKNTALLKRGVWLTAATLVAYAAAPSLVNGALWRSPLVSLAPVGLFLGLSAYFLRRFAFHRAADQVIDCGDHLEIRRGGAATAVPMAQIAAAEVSTHFRIHRITLRLRQPTPFGDRIDFFPQASLWGNLPAIQNLAAQLAARAHRADDPIAGPASPPLEDSR